MIRIDALWLATGPVDMRAGAEGLLARVVQVFGAAQAHHGSEETADGGDQKDSTTIPKGAATVRVRARVRKTQCLRRRSRVLRREKS